MGVRLLAAAAEGGFHAPGTEEFVFAPVFGSGALAITKPLLIIALAAVVVAAFFLASARKASLVPSRMQFAGESVYGFVRNSIGVDAIGKEGAKFAPYLVTLFCLIFVMNFAGVVPLLQMPPTAFIAIPAFLAFVSWAVFNYVGIRRHGLVKYFRTMLFPPGVPAYIYPLLAPIELFSTFFIRPVTLALRLTLNMFAGHLVLALFIVGGEYLLFQYGGIIGVLAGSFSILGSIVMAFFELVVQFLQAYVFTLLTALYIGGAMAEEH